MLAPSARASKSQHSLGSGTHPHHRALRAPPLGKLAHPLRKLTRPSHPPRTVPRGLTNYTNYTNCTDCTNCTLQWRRHAEELWRALPGEADRLAWPVGERPSLSMLSAGRHGCVNVRDAITSELKGATDCLSQVGWGVVRW